MKIGKKIATGLFMTAMTVTLLCGCGAGQQANQSSENDKIKIVCASFPEYDWTRQIVGEENANIELTLIVNNGMDIHNYQPSVEDMVKIDDCDLIIYNGGTSEEWIEEAVEDSQKKPQMLSVMNFLEDDVVEEEVVEGMQEEKHAHETEGEHEDNHTHEAEAGQEEQEYDEHVWLSLKNAEKMVNQIAETVAKIDPEQTELYETNKNAYLEKLESLDASYETAVQEAKGKILLFGDRFPFRYLTEDYGLAYYAAFPGCSAETEASFETIVFLADKIEEHKLPCILTIDGSDKTIAESIQKNADGDVAIKELNSLQAVSEAQITEGMTYLSVMEENLEVIKEALQ
jgi:zinc transport system substrate-binding protein